MNRNGINRLGGAAAVSSFVVASVLVASSPAPAAGQASKALEVVIAGAEGVRALAPDGESRLVLAGEAYLAQASPSGDAVAAVSRDGRLVLVDAQGRESRQIADDAYTEFGGLVWSPDGAEYAASVGDGLAIFDRDGNRRVRLRREDVRPPSNCNNERPAYSLAPLDWTANDELLVLAWADCFELASQLLVIDAASGAPRFVEVEEHPVLTGALGERGTVAAGQGGRIVVINPDGRRTTVPTGDGVAFFGERLALVDPDALSVLEPGDPAPRQVAALPPAGSRLAVDWSADGRYVAVSGFSAPVDRVDVQTGERTELLADGATLTVSWLEGPGTRVDRRAGPDRMATAAAVSRADFPDGTEVAVLARADEPADALSGAALAVAEGAAVLLSWPDDLPPTTREELARLGVRRVVLLGGESALGPDVVAELEDDGLEVDRVAGPDRFGTAAEVAARLPDGADMAVVANGTRYADALGGAAIGAAERAPLLLVTTDDVPAATERALRDRPLREVVVVGGEQVVSRSVIERLSQICDCAVRRVAGAERSATSVELAEYAIAEHAFDGTRVVLARGDVVVDAVAGAARAGRLRAPLLLAPAPDVVGPALGTWLSERQPLERLEVLGDHSAVNRTVAKTAWGGPDEAASE